MVTEVLQSASTLHNHVSVTEFMKLNLFFFTDSSESLSNDGWRYYDAVIGIVVGVISIACGIIVLYIIVVFYRNKR